MALRELATAWARANCPRPDVQENFLHQLDQAIQRGVNCSFMVGRELTKSNKPFLVYCFRDEVFAFVLTPQQFARLNVADNMLVCAGSPRVNEPVPMATPVVSLEDVEVDNAAALDRMQPITGTARYRTTEFITKPLAIHAVFEPPGRPSTVLSHHMYLLPSPEGTIRFSLSPLSDLMDADGTQFTGLVPMFFQIWLTAQHDLNPNATFPRAPTPSTPPWTSWTAPPAPKPHRSPLPVSSPFTPKPVMPAMSPYPPTYDPGGQTPAPIQDERPISDVRAVLIDIL